MFEPQHALQEFVRVLTSRGLAEHTLNLVDGCEALFDFYKDMRPLGQVFERHEDADMLLFQWGSYDWGEGEHFSQRVRGSAMNSPFHARPDPKIDEFGDQ